MWTHIFHVRTLDGETRFFSFFISLKNHLKNGFGVATYFSFFLRETKIRNKNPRTTPYVEKHVYETESKFEGHITYWEGTVVSHNTPLIP